MALTLVLELPNATSADYAVEPRVRIATLELDHAIHLIPLTGQIAPPSTVEMNEGEPTWEDAAWQ